jgi:septal ring factor EnvC (AmiA/AmiB activator)
MKKFEHYGDLYGITLQNTNLHEDHIKLYEKYKAASIGDLLDKMQLMLERYERAIDNSSTDLVNLEDTINSLKKELETLQK